MSWIDEKAHAELARIRHVDRPGFKATTVPMLFSKADGPDGLARATEELCRKASQAVDAGFTYLILSDRGVDREHAPIPALLATAGVHHHLVREGKRVIYVNAFRRDPFAGSAQDWHTTPVILCDGDPGNWGVLYDPGTRLFFRLAFNGNG